MKLDREMQRRVLEHLADVYPDGDWEPHRKIEGPETKEPSAAFLATMRYLAEHELVDSGYELSEMVGSHQWMASARSNITARGLDFLADDGGLSAILSTVTVRIDATQFAELLAAKVEQLPNLSAEERSTIAGELRKLPAKSAEKVLDKLLDWTVDHAGDALPLLRTLLAAVAP
jgi:hypothetical protein